MFCLKGSRLVEKKSWNFQSHTDGIGVSGPTVSPVCLEIEAAQSSPSPARVRFQSLMAQPLTSNRMSSDQIRRRAGIGTSLSIS